MKDFRLPKVLTTITHPYISMNFTVEELIGYADLEPEGSDVVLKGFIAEVNELLGKQLAQLKAQNVRIVGHPGDATHIILARTIAELQREKDFLLANHPISPETRTLLESIDPTSSIEALKLLDNVIDNINWEAASKDLPPTGVLEIDLYAHKLTRIPERLIQKLRQYPRLMKLDLTLNQINFLPESIGDLTTLKTLNLSGNPLPTLPGSIANLTKLESLRLDGRYLIFLPAALEQILKQTFNNDFLELIEPLQAAHPSPLIPRLLPSVAELQKEKNLLLSNYNTTRENRNLLAQIDPASSIEAQKQLDEIIDNINWERASKNLPSTGVLEIDLSSRNLTRIPARLIQKLSQYPRLRTLTLANNQILLLPESINNLTTLTSLDLANNQLNFLPKSIGKLTTLTTFNLWGNPLPTLPESIKNLTQLSTLRLDSKYLISIPTALKKILEQTYNTEYLALMVEPTVSSPKIPAKKSASPLKDALPALYEAIQDSPGKVKTFASFLEEKETIDLLKDLSLEQCKKLSTLLNGKLAAFSDFTPEKRQAFLKVFKRNVAGVAASSVSVSASVAASGAPIVHAYIGGDIQSQLAAPAAISSSLSLKPL